MPCCHSQTSTCRDTDKYQLAWASEPTTANSDSRSGSDYSCTTLSLEGGVYQRNQSYRFSSEETLDEALWSSGTRGHGYSCLSIAGVMSSVMPGLDTSLTRKQPQGTPTAVSGCRASDFSLEMKANEPYPVFRKREEREHRAEPSCPIWFPGLLLQAGAQV